MAGMTADNWQPIETAPKDGTWILGLLRLPVDSYPAGRVVAVRYWTEAQIQEDEGDTEAYQEGWYTHDLDGWTPTWWIPLPEPPKT